MEDKLKLEEQEISNILDRGVEFKVGKGRFIIKSFYLGTLDILADLFIKLEIDLTEWDQDAVTALNHMTKKSARVLAKIAAVAVLNSRWKIKFLSPFLASYFYWKLKPAMLINLVEIIVQMSNRTDFITSIRSIAGATRTTKPNLVEQNN